MNVIMTSNTIIRDSLYKRLRLAQKRDRERDKDDDKKGNKRQ